MWPRATFGSCRNAQNHPKTCCPLGAVENRRHPCLPRSDDVRRNRSPHDVRFSVCRSIRMGVGGVGACFRRPRHGRGFLADCVDRSSRLGCGATANPGKGHRGTGQQGENIARSQGVSARHPGWPRAWLAAPGTLIAHRHSRCAMGTRDAQRCWPFRRRLMRMRDPRPRRECRTVAVETEDRVVTFVGRGARGILYARTRTLAPCSCRIRETRIGPAATPHADACIIAA